MSPPARALAVDSCSDEDRGAGADVGRVNAGDVSCWPVFFGSRAQLARAIVPVGFNDRDTTPGRALAVDCFVKEGENEEEEEDNEEEEEEIGNEERHGEREEEDARDSASRRAVAGLLLSRSLLPGKAKLTQRL